MEPLKRLLEIMNGRGREVEVTADGTIRESAEEPTHPVEMLFDAPRSEPQTTKLMSRTYGSK